MQEKVTRPGKTQYGADLRDLNKVGNRIKWCRVQLGLMQKDVCTATGIPKSTYIGRENGVRSTFPEEFLVLAIFFNDKWQDRFKKGYPEFEGHKIKQIDVVWILFGVL